MRIYVMGYMGSGKSTQGKKLATKLKLPFYDIDKMIEAIEGKSVSEIFAEKGEWYFRDLEADVLRSTILFPDAVIACGGGTPCFYNNIQWINHRGISIYLKVPVEMIFQRIKDKKAKRPLIAHMSDEELKDFIIKKSSEREYYYKKARFTFNMEHSSIKEVAETLMLALPELKG